MKLNEPNLLIEAAESGNFAAFCIFSLLEGVNLEKISDFEDFYEEIRKKLPNCKETEDSSWFSLQEFFDFYENSENLLLEVASTQSRMKMRRAAKRTVRIRARKRAIREKLRKNKTQLAKRAYNQVKTEMRNRLSGGKPWSSLSFSTRNRIDSMISKRKPILKRLVRQRVQKMPAQESQRLRKLSMREEYIQNEINLQETSNKQREREQGRERKRRFDRRNKEDPFRLVNRSYLVTGKKGKKSIVDRDSLTPNHKDVTKLSLGEQYLMTIINEAKETTVEGACNEKDITTERSKELGCPDKKTTEKKSKREKKENTTTATATGTTREMTSQEQNQSPQLSSWVSEQSPVIAQQILMQVDNGNEFLQNFQEASAVHQNIQQSGGNIASGDPGFAKYEQVNKVLQQVFEKIYENEGKKSEGKSRQWVTGLLGNPGSMDRIFSQYNSLDSYLSQPSADGGIWVLIGSKRIQTAPMWRTKDKTSKADLIHFSGEMFLSGMNLPDRYDSAIKWIEEWTDPKKNPEMIIPSEYRGYVSGYSIKSDGRIMSASVGAEGHAMILNAINSIQSDPSELTQEEKDKVKEILEFLTDIKDIENKTGLYYRGELRTKQRGNYRDTPDSKINEVIDKLQTKLDKLINDPSKLGIRIRTLILGTAVAGREKFSDGSIGLATHLVHFDPETNEAKPIEITDQVLHEMAIKGRIDVGVKSTSIRAGNEILYKKNLQIWYEKNGKKYTQGDINKALAKNERMLLDPNIPELKSMEHDAIKTLIDSMKVTDDDPNGKILEIQKSLISEQAREPLRSIWTIFNFNLVNPVSEDTTTPSTLTAHFSYNPLLSYLIETNKSKTELTPEQKQSLDEIIQKTQSDFIELAKTDFEIMLKLLGLEIDSVYIEPSIYIDDYVKKQKTSRANSVYVNGTLHMIPVDENPENMEENTRVTFASRFLNENKKRNYKSEYENYHSKSEQIKNRSKRNMARRWAERKGLVKKGDGKDIDHKNGDPKDNSPSNLRVRSRSANRADND